MQCGKLSCFDTFLRITIVNSFRGQQPLIRVLLGDSLKSHHYLPLWTVLVLSFFWTCLFYCAGSNAVSPINFMTLVVTNMLKQTAPCPLCLDVGLQAKIFLLAILRVWPDSLRYFKLHLVHFFRSDSSLGTFRWNWHNAFSRVFIFENHCDPFSFHLHLLLSGNHVGQT